MDQAKGSEDFSIKNRLRQRIKKSIKDISEQEQLELSEDICKQVESLDTFKESQNILGYYPLAREVNLIPLWLQVIARGKKLYLPRIDGETMDFLLVNDINSLQPNPWGIMEPIQGSPFWQPGDSSLLIAPGLAFDLQGGRLGRGGGFYDRWLNLWANRVYSIGVCFPRQLVKKVPRSSWDIGLDRIISPLKDIQKTNP
ncbi:MAG: 5-formyltetrahydrofolate cyclo-ligase [Spirochaetaceae bacterium]|jgi:5-formyltetrahydrofolate cyclo-ligase|nr:5-formyltetrahydrofolate cyclo-ligase [Spirochaetaceae bacterium]